MYKHIIRPILFRFDAEKAHNLTLWFLKFFKGIPFVQSIIRLIFKTKSPKLARQVFGIDFKHPVGLAAGLDKNGEHYNELADLGFSFVEIGSLTPEPQSGNPTPRLFRLPQDSAIINRMGINNKGINSAIKHIISNPPHTILIASLAKNTSSTSDQEIIEDYKNAFSRMYDFADAFTVNVSCPNVVGLQSLQDVSYLSDIIDPLLDLRICFDTYKPLLVKISPDIPHDELQDILKYCMLSGIDGVVAGNTTRSREGLKTSPETVERIGNGGLSGAPLYKKSLALVKSIHEFTEGRLPIIGVGGIMSPAQAKEMLDAGASLIELYTGFIYEGPAIVKKTVKYLEQNV